MRDLGANSKVLAHVERVVVLMGDLSENQRIVCGLMDAYQFFLKTEGDRSPSAEEALRLLLCEEMRPAVREWYRRASANMNDHALRFRERLGALAGEEFGHQSP